MSIRPFRDIKRRVTKIINVGKIKIGGNNPISVQSMTNTLTKNTKETLTMSAPVSEILLICSIVDFISLVNVFVID